MSQIDVANAKQALATRLRMWGIGDEASKLADGFINDLMNQGWDVLPHRETRKHPPQAHEECAQHPGQYRLSCGGCAADRRAAKESAEAAAAELAATTIDGARESARAALTATRATLCAHHVPPTHCADCGARTEENA